jgi:hypothetical protein
MKPSQDPKADQLINSNMPQGDTGVTIPDPNNPDPNAPDPNAPDPSTTDPPDPTVDPMLAQLDQSSAEIDAALAGG